MRTLISPDNSAAAEAVALFIYRIGREIGSQAAALGGLDTLVFTAGIGEKALTIRERIGAAASWLGVGIDVERNRRGGETISLTGSGIDVIPTDEEMALGSRLISEPRRHERASYEHRN